MSDLVGKVGEAIEPYLDYETGSDGSKDSAARAAITATLHHLADKWQGAEAYIVVENWHETETHDVNIADWLRHQAEQIGESK